MLPEIDDEVLVGFEHGDIHRPYIVGGVWNGKDKTVETADRTVKKGKVNVRSIRTRTGHEIKFVEEDDGKFKAGIYIESKGGQHVHLNDSKSLIEIKTSGKINIDAKKEINITSSGLGGINLNSKFGPITMKARSILMTTAPIAPPIPPGSISITTVPSTPPLPGAISIATLPVIYPPAAPFTIKANNLPIL